jgi:2-amino-4-hydroxy-6-hydroxymethyldihydropteridine diphosphokinase
MPPLPHHHALIALGANTGDRLAQLTHALHELSRAHIQPLAVSPIYETAPMYVTDQPTFYNACALLHTTISPHALLAQLLHIEHQLGRVRLEDKGPRTIDLDLLASGPTILHDATLDLPHPGIAQRHFVLAPLCDIAPDWLHPELNLTASTLLARCPQDPSLTLAHSRWFQINPA